MNSIILGKITKCHTSGSKSSEPWYFYTVCITHYVYCLWIFLCYWIYLIKIFLTTLIIYHYRNFYVFLKLFYFIYFSLQTLHKIQEGERKKITPFYLYRMSWIGHVFAWGLLEVDTTLWTNWKLFRTRSTPLFPMKKKKIQYVRVL